MHATTPASDIVARHAVWLGGFQAELEGRLGRLLELPAERAHDPRWGRALAETRRFALRPAKRLRPALLAIGHGIARGGGAIPHELWAFAIGVEALHTFLLVH